MSSLSKRLLELHYDLLPEEEQEQLKLRIEREPEVARLHEEAKQTAKLFAQAAKVEPIPPLSFSAHDEEKQTVAPPPERPESISSTRIPRPTVSQGVTNIPAETRRIISSAIAFSTHLHPPEVHSNENAELDSPPVHAPHRSLWKPFEGRFSTQHRLSNRLLTTCSLLLLIFTFLGFLQIKAQRSLLTQKMFHIKVAGPGVLTRETQNLLSVAVSDFAGNTRALPVRVRLLDDYENTFVVYQEKTDPQGQLNLAIENPATLPESVFLEVSAGEPTKSPLPAQTLRQRLTVVDPPPMQDFSHELAQKSKEDLKKDVPLESTVVPLSRTHPERGFQDSSAPAKRSPQTPEGSDSKEPARRVPFRKIAPATASPPQQMQERREVGGRMGKTQASNEKAASGDAVTYKEGGRDLSKLAFGASSTEHDVMGSPQGGGRGMGGMGGGSMDMRGTGMGGMGGGMESAGQTPSDQKLPQFESADISAVPFDEQQLQRGRKMHVSNAEVLVSHENLNPSDPLRFQVRFDRPEYPLIASVSQQGVPIAQVPLKTPASPQEPVNVEIPQNASQNISQSGLMQISLYDPQTVPPQELANSVVFRRGKQYLKIEKQPFAGETPTPGSAGILPALEYEEHTMQTVPGRPLAGWKPAVPGGWPEAVKITDEQGMPSTAKVRFELWSGRVGLREPAAPSPMLLDNSSAIQSTLEYLSQQPRSFSSKLFTVLTIFGTIAGVFISLVAGVLFLLKRVSGYVPLAAATLTGVVCILLGVALVRDRQFSAFSSQIVKRYAHDMAINSLAEKKDESEDSTEVENPSQLLWESLETTDPRGTCLVKTPNQDEFSFQESPLFLKVEAVDEKNRVGYELWQLR